MRESTPFGGRLGNSIDGVLTIASAPVPVVGTTQAISIAAATTLAGALISGPLGVAFVTAAHPQPAWQGASAFAHAYHPVQVVPYLGGLLLVGGLVALLAGLHVIARGDLRVRTTMSLIFGSAFAALIVTNYAIQTTAVPTLATSGRAMEGELLALFTMSNPESLGWTLEMWGYALLGVATWLSASVLTWSRSARVASSLFIVNGMFSVTGALMTVARPGWVLRPTGLVAYALWNVLIIAMMVSVLLAMRTSPSAVVRPKLSPATRLS